MKRIKWEEKLEKKKMVEVSLHNSYYNKAVGLSRSSRLQALHCETL
jgi:hypothetical protein